jgi:hypothetical protein
MAEVPVSSAGAILAPADGGPEILTAEEVTRRFTNVYTECEECEECPPPRKFRPLLSTAPAEWDTEEGGCLLPLAAGLFGGLIGYVVVFLWTYLT